MIIKHSAEARLSRRRERKAVYKKSLVHDFAVTRNELGIFKFMCRLAMICFMIRISRRSQSVKSFFLLCSMEPHWELIGCEDWTERENTKWKAKCCGLLEGVSLNGNLLKTVVISWCLRWSSSSSPSSLFHALIFCANFSHKSRVL